MSGRQLLAPTDSQEFERLVRRVFDKKLSLPQLFGRNGQKQFGADIIAYAHNGDCIVIQCKLKDNLAVDQNLRPSDFENEARAARKHFGAGLRRFILASTAPNDTDLQDRALALTREFSAENIEVHYYGWHDLRNLISEDPELREDFLGESGVSALSEKTDAQHQAVMAEFSQMRALLQQASSVPSPHLKRALDRVKVKKERGNSRGALEDLLGLRADEWDTASTQDRHAILFQTGLLYWQLGKQREAAEHFIEASKLLPDDPAGLANLAASLHLIGDSPGALAAARRLMVLDPGCEFGVLAIIQAQEAIAPLPDPLDAISSAQRSCEEAHIGRVQVLRNRDDREWHNCADEAVRLHPDSVILRRLWSDSVLHRLAASNGGHAGASTPHMPSWEDVASAAQILKQQWQQHLALAPFEIDTHLAQNLAQLLRALGRVKEGLEVVDAAGADISPEGNLTQVRGRLLAMAGRRLDAINALSERIDVPANRIFLCELSDDPNQILQLINESNWGGATADQLLVKDVLACEARAALEADYDPTSDLENIAQSTGDDLLPLLAILRRSESDAALNATVSRLLAAATEQAPFSLVLQAAAMLRGLGRPRDVVALLKGRVSTARESQGLHWLIRALIEMDDRSQLSELLGQVADPLASTMDFLNYRSLAFFNRGDVAKARPLLEEMLAREPDHLGIRMLWLNALRRLGEDSIIRAWLVEDVESLGGRLEDKLELGHFLSTYGFGQRAISYTYRLARLSPDNKAAQDHFLIACFFDPRATATPIVALGTVFKLKDAAGAEHVFRLEAEEGLPRENMDITADSPLGKVAVGKAEGDEICIPAAFAGAPGQVYKITEIIHTSHFLFNLLSDTVATRFDGPPLFQKFRVDPLTGEGLNGVHSTLRTLNANMERGIDFYRRGALPLRLIALSINRDIFQTYDLVRANDRPGFRTAEGPDLFDADAAITANQRKGCVVDALTLEIIRNQDLYEIIASVMGPLSITQTSLDQFTERAEHDRAFGAYKKAGPISVTEEAIAFVATTPAALELEASQAAATVPWVRKHTSLVPALGTPQHLSGWIEGIPERKQCLFLDDILAASHASLPLISDDHGYRHFSKCQPGLEALSLQQILRHALDHGEIELELYVRKLAGLARAGHRFLRVGSPDLMEALRIDADRLGPTIAALLLQLGGEGSNLHSHLTVATTFLNQVWMEVRLEAIRLQLIMKIAERFFGDEHVAQSDFAAAAFRDPDQAVTTLAFHVRALPPESARKLAANPSE